MDKLEYVARSLQKSWRNVYESYAVNAIYQKVNNSELEIVTQQPVRLKEYKKPRRIDLYLPQLYLAIEVDEFYHNSPEQQERDREREQDIQDTVITDERIQFRRIELGDEHNLSKFNQQIDKVVAEIKERIAENGELKWYYDDELIKEIRDNRHYITTNDCFSTNCEIINLVYRLNFKGFQRAGYKDLWFPHLSDKIGDTLTNSGSWENFYNEDKTIIYERSVDSKKQAKKLSKDCAEDELNKLIRVVFL